MAAQEQRLASLEAVTARLAENGLLMAELLAGQEERLRLAEERLRLAEERLEETRRDVQQNRNLWVRLAQRYGWIDEDGLFDEPV